MSKRLVLLVLLASLLLIPLSVQAEDKISILDTSVENRFPSALIFNLKAESTKEITKVRLHYWVDKISYVSIVSEGWPKFTPAPKVTTKWVWDTRRASLPPGALIKYWWTVEDATGRKLSTPPATVAFEDKRHPWQTLSQNNITLYWYKGTPDMARELMATSQKALQKLAQDTGVYLEKPIKIYIYAGSEDLQKALVFPTEWTGGVAFTRYSVIALGISPEELSWGKKALAHELAHLVIHQKALSPYGKTLPTWLDEGLALYAEGEPDPYLQSLLEKAISKNKLISVRSLSSRFSARTEEALLSYAQSDSLVRFLIQNYGKDKMLQLLNLLKEGNTYDEALTKAYGFDTEGLDVRWRTYISGKTQPKPSFFSFLQNLRDEAIFEFPYPALEWAR